MLECKVPAVITQLLEGNNHGNCEKSCEEGACEEGPRKEGCTGEEGRTGEEGCSCKEGRTGEEGCSCKEGRTREEGCSCEEGTGQEAHAQRRVHEGPDPQPATRGCGRHRSAAPHR